MTTSSKTIQDVSIKATWYIGTFDVDINGDQIDEVLDFALVDTNSVLSQTLFYSNPQALRLVL